MTSKDILRFFQGGTGLGIRSILVAMMVVTFGWLFADRMAGLFYLEYRSAVKGLDNGFYYFWLKSVFVDGDVDFENDIRETNILSEEEKKSALNGFRTDVGLIPNKWPVGWALASVPWYLVAEVLTRCANALGGNFPREGYSHIYQMVLFTGNLGYALAGLFFAYLICRRVSEYAFEAVVLTGMGSMLLYYQASNLSMSHHLLFMAVGVTYWLTWRLKENPAPTWLWAGVGVASAWIILSRYQGGVFLIYPACVLWMQAVRVKHGWWKLALASLCGLAMLAPQFLAWYAVYGKPFLYTYEGEGFYWGAPKLMRVLWDAHHGLFYWNPILLIGAMGFAVWWMRSGKKTIEGWCWLLGGLSVWYVNAAWHAWHFDAAFGARAFDGCVLFFMWGMTWLLHRISDKKWVKIICALLIPLVLWNINLTWLARKDYLPMSGPVTHEQMWETTMRKWCK